MTFEVYSIGNAANPLWCEQEIHVCYRSGTTKTFTAYNFFQVGFIILREKLYDRRRLPRWLK